MNKPSFFNVVISDLKINEEILAKIKDIYKISDEDIFRIKNDIEKTKKTKIGPFPFDIAASKSERLCEYCSSNSIKIFIDVKEENKKRGV